MFRNFLQGHGKAFVITSQEIRQSKAYSRGIEINREKFEQSMQEGGTRANGAPHPFLEQIRKMRDGEAIMLKDPLSELPGSDHWDDIIGPMTGIKRGDWDQSGSAGSIQMRSNGILTAFREGDTVRVRGRVDHVLQDEYNFNDKTWIDKIALKDFRRMQDGKYGTPFPIYGETTDLFRSEITIDGETIEDAIIQWIPER
jgi:hypothetical protein